MKKLNKDINFVVENYLGFDTRMIKGNTIVRLEEEFKEIKVLEKSNEETANGEFSNIEIINK